ncbi:MAG: branched-chain alpha-keto acid dehydrogenase subunit E2 [Trueperaceae bacterium]|nr:MAG: branched-chain alpha-keto acid dehydrogenase subunit E2 [Trueperaceae bacterium]
MATDFKLPDVGEGIDVGTVVAVLVAEGDRIEVDQGVLELETDKAVVEVPSTVAGVVSKVHVSVGAEAKVGQVVLSVDEGADAGADAGADQGADEGADDAGDEDAASDDARASAQAADDEDAADDTSADEAAAPARERAPDAPAPAPSKSSKSSDADDARPIPAAPSVRRLARERGVDLRAITGTGVLGRISAEDVERFAAGDEPARPAAAAAAAPAPTAAPLPDFSKWGETERAAMSGIRKATVRSMTNAWTTVPMVTHFDSADATEFEALRQRYKKAAEAIGAKLTPTAMLIKVVAAALRKYPDFNASLDVDAQEIVYKRYVNVGVAVDTDHGLLVPVIKHADRKSILALADELGVLADKARDRKLSPDDMQGGNFSVSNLGGIGGHGFTPIVNPPDVAILGVSRSRMEPVWDAEQNVFVPRLTMPLALTYDHRLIDGAAAARFLRWVCRAIEEPFLMALEG